LSLKVEAARLGADRTYAAWLTHNVKPHTEPGYAAVVLSLKSKGLPPGDASDTQLDSIADLADRFSMSRAVVTYAQNVVFPHVQQSQLPELYAALSRIDMATPNVDLASDIICCPGLDFCSLANARSIPIAMQLGERLDQLDFVEDVGPCSIKISGCINACGHHHVGNIGILGIDKHGDEAYQLMLGGCESDSASIGKVLGPALSETGVVDAVEAILKQYLVLRADTEETFLECYRRLGAGPFKEAAYASH
jgi:sulfite reductase (NADPH) hemoprotein beta-component